MHFFKIAGKYLQSYYIYCLVFFVRFEEIQRIGKNIFPDFSKFREKIIIFAKLKILKQLEKIFSKQNFNFEK
jgi:hypothetical protein